MNALTQDQKDQFWRDGVLLVEERVMIEKLAEAWGCDTIDWDCDPAGGTAAKLEDKEKG